MTNSFYGVVYRGGIALPMGIANVKFLIEHNSEVELLERFTSQDAYIWATQTYVDRKKLLRQYVMPVIPIVSAILCK